METRLIKREVKNRANFSGCIIPAIFILALALFLACSPDPAPTVQPSTTLTRTDSALIRLNAIMNPDTSDNNKHNPNRTGKYKDK